MRLFIALNLPPEERDRLYQATEPLRGAGLPVRWVEAAGIHVTLKFLGEVRGDKLDAIKQAVRTAAGKSTVFRTTVGGFGAFPTLRRPRVLWVGVAATPEMRCLKHDLEWELARLGYEREVRAFVPHITLGRAAADRGAGDFRMLEDLIRQVDYGSALEVESLDVMRSHLSPAGARYERLVRFELAAATRHAARGT
jgi:RNA 2',3'-cyclic 3'-phosphodiesterase